MKNLVDYFFNNILPYFLNIYEKRFMYRVKASWGKVHLNKIKNKGANVNIVGYSRFLDPDNLILGDNVRIGYNCFFFCKGGIEIGNNTILSRDIIIYSSNHNYLGNAIPYDNTHIHKPVKIGNGVWIGMGVIITPGVEIGDGAIIGMGTVVSKNINAGEIVVGTGQRTVSNRDMTSFIGLENEGKIFSKLWPND